MTKHYSIFHIEGGLGKHVAATSVAKAIKKNYPERDLIVVCAYPEVFINLKYVSRVYRHGHTPYFYQDYIKGRDFLMFRHEPYFTTEHIKKETPLAENWCKLYGLEYSGELPEIQYNFRQQQYNSVIWNRSKPILLLQTHGGSLEDQSYRYSWTRDMPPYLYTSIIKEFGNYYHIIQVCRNEDQSITHPDVEVLNRSLTNMELFGLVEQSAKRLLIDSALQHIAAALKKPSTVLWVGTDPKVFGYELHRNIKANLNDEDFKLPDSYIFDYSFNGTLHECPIGDQTTLFDIQEVIDSIKF
jgi:hypothetical protein